MFLNRSEQLFGRNRFTITLSETVRIMKSICSISEKILSVGATMSYTQNNRGIGFATCVCVTNAKLAIKEVCKEKINSILKRNAPTDFYLSGFNILMSSSISESFLRILKELFLEKAP